MGNTRPSHGLVDKVHMSFRLLPETLYLALSTMDRFLSARVLGQVTVAWHHLHVSHCQGRGDRGTIFLYCADLLYIEAEFLQPEKNIPKALEWNMGNPNPLHFLHRVSKARE